MSTDLLTLMQWLSPGFPVGAFAYSHGLEDIITSGRISDADTLQIWMQDLVSQGSGRSDISLLARAWRGEAMDELTATAVALAGCSGRVTETGEQGAAFCRTVDAVWDTGIGVQAYPVAVGCAAARHGLPLELTAQAYLHAFAANLISAAVRLVPLGQTEGQQVLATLAPLICSVAQEATADGAPLFSNCIAADIAAMRHETLYSKVFRT
ncbi:urease accessory UreF family protein [uncultured Roseobacter sp.]|uniref:urease accessory protein UreF n=1 Tax=uncultured Roseobacter sp. TaxID=114847 RepID=UPI002634CE0A|nr:urease accessory UreF family protein [uncultured Roseobacter sp.]